LDDEYFRTMLAFHHQAAEHSEARGTLASVARGLAKREQVKFRRRFLAGIQPVRVVSPAGEQMGTVMGYPVDLVRLGRVTERVTKGLYYLERGSRLPDGYIITSRAEDGLSQLEPAILRELQATILGPLSQVADKAGSRGVLRYRVVFDEKDPGFSAWLLTFYDCVPFLSLTIREGSADPEADD
jgi:hypothetical protein